MTDRRARLALWGAAIAAFGFGDTMTSLLVFDRGGAEANVLLGLVLGLVGPTVGSFIGVKMATVVGVIIVSRLRTTMELGASLLMLGLGSFLTVQNLTLLVG